VALPTNRELLFWAAEHYIDATRCELPANWRTEIPETFAAGRLIEDYSWHQFRGRSQQAGMQTIADINQLLEDARKLLVSISSSSKHLA